MKCIDGYVRWGRMRQTIVRAECSVKRAACSVQHAACNMQRVSRRVTSGRDRRMPGAIFGQCTLLFTDAVSRGRVT